MSELPSTDKIYDALREAWDKLNEWEQGFVKDTHERFKKYGSLLEKPQARLEIIYRTRVLGEEEDRRPTRSSGPSFDCPHCGEGIRISISAKAPKDAPDQRPAPKQDYVAPDEPPKKADDYEEPGDDDDLPF